MENFKRIIVVTGTPCVGKTVVSSLLASKLHALHIDIGELVKREKLWSGVDKARKTLIADMPKLSKRVQEIIEHSERDVVLDGHYAVDVVPAKNVHVVFVLRREPDELRRSMRKRGFKGKKLNENLAAEVLDVCLHGAVKACGVEKVCEIDVTGKSAEQVVDEAVAVLKGKKTRTVGIVDWVGKLESEGRLEEFLEEF
ncbi:MAG: adenylate kinase family protein [Candidatus Bathyarchaeia archaeon]